ncbi:hypothetical protein FQN57_003014 [Myotisia sp. PD_48]|nr:hypothetical protein FQN57_003014 [Myotisia sp. PD_48]
MAAGFNFSVGDFVVCIKLVRDIWDAFDETKGAKLTHQRLVTDLNNLLLGLKELRSVSFDDASSATGKETLEQIAIQCQTVIESFLARNVKYERSLGNQHTSSGFRRSLHKVQWAVCMGAEIDKLRSEILGHTTAINTLLFSMQSSTAVVQTELIKSCRRETQEQTVLARETQTQIGQTNNILRAQADAILKISEILEPSDIRPKAQDVRSVMVQALDMNMKVCRIALDIQKSQSQSGLVPEAPSIPQQIERQHPVQLEDAHGRITPFHVEFINSLEAFQAVMEARFKHVPGLQKIRKMEYAMKESGSNRRLNLQAPWESVFLPGRTVNMSMVFWSPSTSLTCPGCGLANQECRTDHETQCPGLKCNLWYEHVVGTDMSFRTNKRLPVQSLQFNTPFEPFSHDLALVVDSDKDEAHHFRRVQVRHVIEEV